jgi:glycosyltransferase involved in cell wall biosynthesis
VKISVVTPCYNALDYLPDTVQSVLQQTAVVSGEVELEYLICDGGSTDGTLDYLRTITHPSVSVSSEPDNGMYHALAKGLNRVSGDIVCYLNAGDLYHPAAFGIVRQVVFKYPEVQFLTGRSTVINERGEVIESNLPLGYAPELLARGHYGTDLPFVQQESTFWRRGLLDSEVLDRLTRFKLAGDLYLWVELSRKAPLFIVDAQLGHFRIHPGQLSEDKARYFTEASSFLLRKSWWSKLQSRTNSLLWKLPPHWKKKLNPQRIITYDVPTASWVLPGGPRKVGGA